MTSRHSIPCCTVRTVLALTLALGAAEIAQAGDGLAVPCGWSDSRALHAYRGFGFRTGARLGDGAVAASTGSASGVAPGTGEARSSIVLGPTRSNGLAWRSLARPVALAASAVPPIVTVPASSGDCRSRPSTNWDVSPSSFALVHQGLSVRLGASDRMLVRVRQGTLIVAAQRAF